MNIGVRIDAAELERLEKLFQALPSEIRHRVAARAMKRVAQMGNAAIVRDIADLIQVPQKHVRARVRTYPGYSDLSLDTKVKSDWIRLIDIGGARLRDAMRGEASYRRSVKRRGGMLRGSYRGAFIATVNGHRSVWRREGAARGPLDEQFGPNPAHAVLNASERYQALLMDTIRSFLLPRIIHEIHRALGR